MPEQAPVAGLPSNESSRTTNFAGYRSAEILQAHQNFAATQPSSHSPASDERFSAVLCIPDGRAVKFQTLIAGRSLIAANTALLEWIKKFDVNKLISPNAYWLPLGSYRAVDTFEDGFTLALALNGTIHAYAKCNSADLPWMSCIVVRANDTRIIDRLDIKPRQFQLHYPSVRQGCILSLLPYVEELQSEVE